MTHSPTSDDCVGCSEYSSTTMSRRGFLTAAGVAATATAFGPVFREVAYAAAGAGSTLVVLSLRGGIDGMSLVVPHGDPAYRRARPSIAVPRTALLHANATFGLHPQMAPLSALWRDRRLAAVQAIGMPAPNRSHFAAMEAVESADPGSRARRGWLNRLISTDALVNPLEAVQIGSVIPGTAVTGPHPSITATSLDQGLALSGADPRWDNATWSERRVQGLATTYAGEPGPLGRGGRDALTAWRQLRNVAGSTDSYPRGDLAQALASTAALIKAQVGAKVVTVESSSWDHHVGAGTLEWGRNQQMIAELAGCVAAFFTDLGAAADKVTLVTVSEFGRRLEQNGSGGTDHGWGNMMLVAGAGVRGGAYYGRWPGLGPAKLAAGDLAVTTDYRSVLAEIVRARFPKAPVSKVFPGFKPRRVGVMLGQ